MFQFREREAASRRDTGDYFPLFDWLRFVLASVVALHHGGLIAWENSGNFAVQVFFALSGWLIGSILLRSELSSLPRFYFNRGTRIWLPYAVAVGALYGLSFIREPITIVHLKCLFFDATFTNNWFIPKTLPLVGLMPLKGTGTFFWSISVEEQFYLAAPLLIVLLPFGRSVAFWALICAIAITSSSFYGSISLGVFGALLRARHGDWQLKRKSRGYIVASAGCCTVFMIIAPRAYAWLAPMLAVQIVLLASDTGPARPLGQFLGAISFPLYLYHWVGIFAGHFLDTRFEMQLGPVGGYAIGLLVASLAWLTIDRNIMVGRSRLYSRVIGRGFVSTAYFLLAAGVTGGLIFGF